MQKKIIAILFCIIIFIGFFDLLIEFNDKISISNFIKYAKTELSFNTKIGTRLEKIYDTIQLLLNKKEIGNFTYYKNDQTGGLILITKQLDRVLLQENANRIIALNNELKQKGIPYIYVSMPEEVKDIDSLKNIDYGNKSADLLLENLQEQVNFIDLREYDEIATLTENFYKTDHHWNMETVFASYQIIMNTIQDNYGFKVPAKYLDLENYKQEVVANSFFGSKGVNVGEKYVSKENFMILLPKYDTNFEYKQLNTKGDLIVHTTGNFEQALTDKEKLYTSAYINKYNIFLYAGDCENIIINQNAENDKKVLLISSSFGRALAPYISQCFQETRYIDPQKNRFEKDILKYIEEYNPDVVIMLYNAVANMELIKNNSL